MKKTKPKRRKQPEPEPEPKPLAVVDLPPYDDSGTLRCGVCKRAVTITMTGLVCDCPGVRPADVDRKRYYRQVQVSPLDKLTAELMGK